MALDQSADALLLPADPPRDTTLALWSKLPRRERVGQRQIVVALPQGRSVQRLTVPARILSMKDAIPWLASLNPREPASMTVRAWAVVVKGAIALVARGRLSPGVTPLGLDTWRIGPLDAADQAWLSDVIADFPARGHALALPGLGTPRVPSAESMIRACLDAVADTVVRSAGTAAAVTHPVFTTTGRVHAGTMENWIQGDFLGLGEGSHLGLRLVPPEAPADPLVVRLQLRSAADPALVMDVAQLWSANSAAAGAAADDTNANANANADADADADADAAGQPGDAPDAVVRAGLSRGAEIWPPLGRISGQFHPERLLLADEEATDLVGPAGEALAAAGIEVLWPTEATGNELTIRAVIGRDATQSAGAARLDLDALLDFRWEVCLGGEPLTAAELAQLAAAERPLIRLRGRWVIIDPRLAERLRAGSQPVRARDALAAALSGRMTIGGDIAGVLVEGPLADLAARLVEIARPTEIAEPPGLRAVLRAYQRRGVGWLNAMCALGVGGCLADDMGLGKTLQVIALHLHRAGGPMLVVCPTSMLGGWERELHRFAPSVCVRRYHGGERHLDAVGSGEVVLATYGMVRRDRADLARIEWDLVVADEAQHIKNPRSRSAHELAAIPARARLALTGTPVENRLADLWSILNWTTPGLLGPLDDFRDKVATPIERDHDLDTAERFARVVRPFLLRRRKIDPDIAPELPLKTEADVVVPLSPEQAGLYEQVVSERLGQIAEIGGARRRGVVLALITSLKQICNHPAQYLHEDGPLRRRSGKLAALDELLDVIIGEGDSVLVFTQYVAMARLLETHLRDRGIATQLLHGQVPAEQRDVMVQRFQAGAVPVFLLSLKAGGVGLTLTRANHVIHYDRWWNPAVEDQATDRAYRIGQERPVQVHRLVTEGTVEDRIAALLQAKRKLADMVVGGGESWIGELDNADLADLVRLRLPGGQPRG